MTDYVEPAFLSDLLARIMDLHQQSKHGVIKHMLPLLRRLVSEYWVTDEEQEFINSLT